MAKNARKLELGPANVYISQLPRASGFFPPVTQAALTSGTVNAVIKFTATNSYPGTAGNAINIVMLGNAGTVPLSVSVGGTPAAPVVTIQLGTTAGVVFSTPNDVVSLFATASAVGGAPFLPPASPVPGTPAAIVTPSVPTGTGASPIVPIASTPLTGGLVDPNTVIWVESVRPGAGFDVAGNAVDYNGNAVTLQFVAGAILGVVATNTAIVVTIPPNTSVDTVLATLRNDPGTSFLITAARAATGLGTGIMAQTLAATALTGGSSVAQTFDLGFLGDDVAYQVTTEASNLTGAQTGNVPQDKVIVGGMVKVVIPFKEISVDNLRRGVPSAQLVENSDGSNQRVDFHVAVGASMRQQLGVQLVIKKIKGGFESTLPADWITIPLISPAEGEVSFPFAPTTQRVINTNWYAWPDPNTGRWAYIGPTNP